VLDGYTYRYDLLGQRTGISRNNGFSSSTVSAGYAAIGELTSWSATEPDGAARYNEQLIYAYDAAGNLQQRWNHQFMQSFTVDAANELTNVTRGGILTVTGNTPTPASSVTINGQPAGTYGDFTFASSSGFALADGLNTFTKIAGNYSATVMVTNTLSVNLPASVNLLFDANGNLTDDGARAFGYDAENQLTNVTVTGQWREDFLYDGLNRRRITRQYGWTGNAWALTNETRFVYDGKAVVQERDNNNVAQVSYTRGMDASGSLQGAGGIGGLLARTEATGSTYYHADGNGNITALMDGNQYIVARYLYDPFGRLLGKWGTMADANVYRFSSKEWDGNAGLYDYLYRSYDPNLQRWLNRDPIGEQGGINLYGFANNNPVNLMDMDGREILDYPVSPNGEPTVRSPLDNPESQAQLDKTGFQLWPILYGVPDKGPPDMPGGTSDGGIQTDDGVFALLAPLAAAENSAALAGTRKLCPIASDTRVQQDLVNLLAARQRQLEPGADAARRGAFNEAQGLGGYRLEQALGRTISPGTDPGVDFVDSQLGSISLKGPLPPEGSLEVLANSVIKDALGGNTATRTVVLDTLGLSDAQVSTLETAIGAGTQGTSKTIIYLY